MEEFQPKALTNQIFKLEETLSHTYQVLGRTVIQLEKYQKAYDILSEHFDLLPDDIKESVHKELGEENL